jgi:hypothetical protein
MSKLYETLHYERFYLAYVGVTLALGLYLTMLDHLDEVNRPFV